ncbi:protein spt [Salix suchowensis]|uniref:PROTEIN SPT2-like protein n=1 Tax=Salix koriyanagi TaxID=2511006 RepID=A0A9Q0U595_9ROSI|nr:protein spt [Salix suchowensis]KAJ6723714.1 PROTEIN SPT2-like protein [Salix koriyanagi]
MRGYGREEDEYYDEYEEEGEEQVEEEYEEEERKPTVEEVKYLELRERIKEQIRKKMRRESGSTLSKSHEKKKLPSDNYGSFFGPSQPVISQRVIQESKSIIENQHLALSVSNAQHTDKKSSSSTATGLKNRPHGLVPKVKNEVKTKVQKLKDTRDYSFLLTDDAELPAPTKELVPRNVFARNSGFFADVQEARSAQVPQKIKQASSNSGRNIHGIREEGKPVFRNAQIHSKVGSQKPASANKLDAASINSKRQLGSNNGTGPGRPAGPKCLPSKTPVSIMQKKASAPSAKKILPAMRKSLPTNLSKPSVPKQHWEQRKGLQEHSKARPIPKQPLSTVKSQINKPIKQVSSHASLRDNRPKKKPVRPFPDACSDDEDAFSMLRKLIGNKNRGKYDDDGDDSDMEANFDDIMKEERRSARIAREEDEEQLRLIEEEERQERERKLAKKRKLSHR